MSEEIKKLVPEIPDDWVFFRNINFSDESVTMYSVDTRDFHCMISYDPPTKFKLFKALEENESSYVFSVDELMALLERLYTESGGNIDWRMLSLEGAEDNWDMKYLRIVRVPNKGLIVCNNKFYAMNKRVLSSKVRKDY